MIRKTHSMYEKLSDDTWVSKSQKFGDAKRSRKPDSEPDSETPKIKRSRFSFRDGKSNRRKSLQFFKNLFSRPMGQQRRFRRKISLQSVEFWELE